MNKISIITPTYNQESFIEQTILSVLNQKYKNFEYIVINDGSTDKTSEILERYKKYIKIINQNNMGQTKSINSGLKICTGNIVAYINSDDTYLHNFVFDQVVDSFKKTNADIVYGRSLFSDKNGKITGEYKTKDFDFIGDLINVNNPIPQPSAFIRKEVFNNIGFFDEKLKYSMDWDFWLRAGFKYKLIYVDQIWSTYRLHKDSKTVIGGKKIIEDANRIYEKILNNREISKILSDKKYMISNNKKLFEANVLFQSLNFFSSLKLFLQVFKDNPKKMNRNYSIKLLICMIPLSSYLIGFLKRIK